MNVKALREQAGLTQEELAEKSGIPRDRIAKWEQGKGKPKAEDFKKLEELFGNLGEVVTKKSNLSDFKGYSGEALKDRHIALLDRENARLEKELKVSLKNIEEDVIAVAGMNKAVLEILLILASEKKGVYNKSFEVLKKYGLEGIFL